MLCDWFGDQEKAFLEPEIKIISHPLLQFSPPFSDRKTFDSPENLAEAQDTRPEKIRVGTFEPRIHKRIGFSSFLEF